jgi:hypothetical protein
MERLTSIISRVFFITAFLLAGIAIWEKLANLMGLTLIRAYSAWRLLEFASVVLLFVIVLQLREIKINLRTGRSS